MPCREAASLYESWLLSPSCSSLTASHSAQITGVGWLMIADWSFRSHWICVQRVYTYSLLACVIKTVSCNNSATSQPPVCRWAYRVYLPVFTGQPPDSVLNDPRWFNGCGGNSVWDLNTIEFRWDVGGALFLSTSRAEHCQRMHNAWFEITANVWSL